MLVLGVLFLKRAAALELQRGKALVQHRAFPLVDEKGAGIHGVADLGVEAGLPVLDRGIGAGHLLLNPEPVAPQFLFEGYIVARVPVLFAHMPAGVPVKINDAPEPRVPFAELDGRLFRHGGREHDFVDGIDVSVLVRLEDYGGKRREVEVVGPYDVSAGIEGNARQVPVAVFLVDAGKLEEVIAVSCAVVLDVLRFRALPVLELSLGILFDKEGWRLGEEIIPVWALLFGEPVPPVVDVA